MAKASKKADDEVKKSKKTPVASKKAVAPKKKQLTVRERTKTSDTGRGKRIRTSASRIKTPIGKARQTGRKEYHLPLPDNRLGKIGRKRVRLAPKFVREAVAEVRQVTWPNANETVRLTIAVFLFATIFAIIVGILDFGLDKLFKEVIIQR